MHVLIAGRGEGKTTKLIEWVKGGIMIRQYPGWTRVAVVVDERSYFDLKRQYWDEIEDFDHRVYQIREFDRGRFPVNEETVYRIDDLDRLLWDFFRVPNLDGFTMTAEPWEE